MKAIQNCNGHNIKGREIAVDWTVSDLKTIDHNDNSVDRNSTGEIDDKPLSSSGNEDENSSYESDSSDDSDKEDGSNTSTGSSSDADTSDDENDEHDNVSKAGK